MTDINDFYIDPSQKESFVITLSDMETGKDRDFRVVAEATINNKRYFAMYPEGESGEDIFVLSVKNDGEELLFETIDDDDEYETVEDYFNDLLFNEADYDD